MCDYIGHRSTKLQHGKIDAAFLLDFTVHIVFMNTCNILSPPENQIVTTQWKADCENGRRMQYRITRTWRQCHWPICTHWMWKISTKVTNGNYSCNTNVLDKKIYLICSISGLQAIETFKLIQQQTMLPKLKDALKIEQKQLSIVWTKSDGNLLKNQN